MCGIAGIVSLEPTDFSAWDNQVENKLKKRGPDHFGSLLIDGSGRPIIDQFSESNIVLWHSRLSIIDISVGANQPMVNKSGVSIVFNGEIYNYVELKQQLRGLGYEFETASDTEVILAAYMHWGVDAFNHFIGMFALILIDPALQHCIIARDGLGIKPLYYSNAGKSLCFSSRLDLTALLSAKSVLNFSKTFHFLEAGFSDYDNETFVSGVNMLMPGEIKIFSINGLKELGTYTIKFIDQHPVQLSNLGYNDKVVALRETLQNVVSLHTRTDVGFCATLSGGLDSTSIAGILLSQGHTNLKLYSYIPELVSISEEKWIDIASAHFGIPVIKMRYDTSDFWSEFDVFSEQIDGPYNSSSMYSQYKIYQNVKKDANTVVLDGQGGDEMFGGYVQYIYYRVYELLMSGHLSSLTKMINGSKKTVAPSFLAKNLVRLMLANKIPNLYHFLRNNQSDAIVKVDYFHAHKVQQIPSFDRDTLMEKLKVDRTTQDLPRLLRYADRNSMAWSLESRVPFASQPIQSFVEQLDASDIISDQCTTKALFRDAIEPFIPGQIFHRKDKKGFNSDDKSILSSFEARDYVSSLQLSKFTFIDKQALIDALEGKKFYRSDKLWRIFSLLKWLDLNKIDV